MSIAQKPKIISVTGTKGKSTITYILASILNESENVLRVDTTGYYINSEQKGNFYDSTRTAGLVPTVSPGRFLITMQDFNEFSAVLECSLGSSNLPGLGYSHHRVGVFANVMEDHLGSTKRLKSQHDIAKAKNFVFSRLRPDGYAVFNADDKFVCSQLDQITEGAKLVPCGLEFKHFDLKKHLKNNGVCVTLEDGWVIVKSQHNSRKIVKINDVRWTFDGQYQPSLLNLLFIVGALWGHNKGKIPLAQRKLLKDSKLNPYGGRLTPLKSKDEVLIIADYAHEKYSLAAIGDLARKIRKKPDNKVIGVVRLSWDRTDNLIADTAEHIAHHYDQFVVYDKIDGFWRKPEPRLSAFKMKTGYISRVFSDNLKAHNPNVSRVVREDKALEKAASIAKPGDVVIVIVNDNIERSIEFIREKFNAEFA